MAVSMLMPTRWSGLHISTSAGGPAGFRLNTRPPAGLPRRAPTREKGEESSLPSQKGLNQHRTPCRAPAPSPNRTLEATGTSQGQGPAVSVQGAPADRPVLRSSPWGRGPPSAPDWGRAHPSRPPGWGCVLLPPCSWLPPPCPGRGVQGWGTTRGTDYPSRCDLLRGCQKCRESMRCPVGCPGVCTAPRLSQISIWFPEAPKSLPLLAAIPSDSPSHQPRRSQALGVPQQRDRLDSEPECTGVSRGFSSCVPAPGSGPQGPGTHAFVQGKCFSGSSSPRPRPVPPFASVLTLASLRPCQLDHPPVWLPSPPHTLPPGQVPAPPPPSPQLSGRPGSQIKGPLAPTSVLSHHRGQHCHLQNLPDAL
ncbi:nascent polypeptide-associated complex subunit alpha, muscle-specific form-like isoform X1 [Leopardus geoffroyi]|uniref:nascent polypeptide-associated complex subunit alpha, muscle-specific form-like isoform X1 n=1 Tax=Leopardus geoffroyi TaxID=46844 RepID=UPI001E25F2A0|nr:nascent polypeptide-associated complex subunit alpha, muscle-specific form-like isoform X1 [Leopardus geoffroyi]